MTSDDRIVPPAWMAGSASTAIFAALGQDRARFVGGCVRDAIIGEQPKDIDIATVLEPPAAIAALTGAGIRVVPTGLDHGTVTAVMAGSHFEITSLRRDVSTDGRHAVVAFTTDWREDAGRRDFTINAMYATAEGEIFDPTGGRADLAAGQVRFVGDAARRIAEDHLRALRYFRFYTRYQRGAPDAAAIAAIRRGADFTRLSGERISGELVRLMEADDPRPGLRLMAELGVLAALLGPDTELAATLAVIDTERALSVSDPWRRLAALLPRVPQRILALAEQLRLSRRESDRCLAVAATVGLDLSTAKARRLAFYRHGTEVALDCAFLDGDRTLIKAVMAESANWLRPRLPVGGDDAKVAGIATGKAIGEALQAVEDWWVTGDFQADRAACLRQLQIVAGQ